MKFREKSTGGKNFLKLKSGESIRGVFRGDIYEFRQHWDIQTKRSILCLAPDICPKCQAGEKSTFRFRLNFVTKENETFVAKVFEQGWGTYECLKSLHEGDYNLETYLMKITRHGELTQTTYSIIPVANGALTKEQEEKISQVKLNDLSHEISKSSDEPELTDADEIPF